MIIKIWKYYYNNNYTKNVEDKLFEAKFTSLMETNYIGFIVNDICLTYIFFSSRH